MQLLTPVILYLHYGLSALSPSNPHKNLSWFHLIFQHRLPRLPNVCELAAQGALS